MKVMRRSRWLARLVAMLVVGVAGLAVAAPEPAQAGIVFQSHVMAAWGHGLLGDGGRPRPVAVRRHQAGRQYRGAGCGRVVPPSPDPEVRRDRLGWGRNGSGQLGILARRRRVLGEDHPDTGASATFAIFLRVPRPLLKTISWHSRRRRAG